MFTDKNKRLLKPCYVMSQLAAQFSGTGYRTRNI